MKEKPSAEDIETLKAFDKWVAAVFNSKGIFRKDPPFKAEFHRNAFGENTIDGGRMMLDVPDEYGPYRLTSIGEGQPIIIAIDGQLMPVLIAGLQWSIAREFAHTFKQ